MNSDTHMWLTPSYFMKASLQIQALDAWILSTDHGEKEKYGFCHKERGSRNLLTGSRVQLTGKAFTWHAQSLGFHLQHPHTLGVEACTPHICLVPA